jgi:branched-subunit amino acid transport protein
VTPLVLAGLAVGTWAVKGAGALVPDLPEGLQSRLQGIAPALLAALVLSQLVGHGGLPHLDARLVGVAVAIILAAVRMPVLVVVIAAAAVTAGLRRLGIA